MPRIIETLVYTIDELSGKARDAARAWHRDCGLHDDWDEFVLEDFVSVCAILGVTLDTRPMPLLGGGTRDVPQVFWSGFGFQGDGASFSGTYEHASGSVRKIRAHTPQDAELHRIADDLQELQRRNFWRLGAVIRQRGRYCHEFTMTVEVERDSPAGQPPTDCAEAAVTEAMRDLARWLHRQLRAEHDHLVSDDVVDESIRANAWTFTAEGLRFG